MNPTEHTIPMLNLRKLGQQHQDEFWTAIRNVVESCGFIRGKEVGEFETAFASWFGDQYFAAGCGNGTDALTMAAYSLKLPPDSEVIVPAMTFIATAGGMIHAGLKVRLVDVKPGTWLMDLDQLEKSITPRTKVIAPVHLYGQMVAMDKLRAIADRHRLTIIEDASQAHGALWKNNPPGHWGDLATYSFYPGKNLGAFGDGGAIVSKNQERIEYCRAFGNQGCIKKYDHFYVGMNSRLDTIQAAILKIKMKYIDSWNDARRSVAHAYREMLSGIEGLDLPLEQEGAKHVYHLYVVL
ncbi:MAG: DegT/DnrJ/EryC1/StrS family aminotransferase, partial [Deltaproteobacteria bacterium]|nr:DegT/DnrJ/EryC1/StrS family aminotransferase [Deltaproteobacteria bacterium]